MLRQQVRTTASGHTACASVRTRKLRRSAHRSVTELKADARRWTSEWNKHGARRMDAGCGTQRPSGRCSFSYLIGQFPGPAHRPTGPSPAPAGAGDLRGAVAALLACADAWHDADPRRRFTPALAAMARARDGTDDTALDRAARSLLSALARHPLTPTPAVAATATRLRRALHPASLPAPV